MSLRPLHVAIMLLAAAASLAEVSAKAAAAAPPAAARPLRGWSGGSDRWRIEGDTITAEIPAGETLGHNEFLWWDGTVGDFDLSLEYRIEGDSSANSGIQFCSERLPDGHAEGYQADLDDAGMLATLADKAAAFPARRAMVATLASKPAFARPLVAAIEARRCSSRPVPTATSTATAAASSAPTSPVPG